MLPTHPFPLPSPLFVETAGFFVQDDARATCSNGPEESTRRGREACIAKSPQGFAELRLFSPAWCKGAVDLQKKLRKEASVRSPQICFAGLASCTNRARWMQGRLSGTAIPPSPLLSAWWNRGMAEAGLRGKGEVLFLQRFLGRPVGGC